MEASTVAMFLTNEMIFRFSPLESLHSDQGRQLESLLNPLPPCTMTTETR